MSRRHLPLPRFWMITDERQDEATLDLVARLPRQVGVIVRHYSLPEPERQALARRIVRRGRIVAYSGSLAAARRAGAHAVYGADARSSALPRLYPVHNAVEISRAERAGAALLLLSPVFATRSHPGRRPLGALRFALLARRAKRPVIALGGMTPRRFERVQKLGATGWAAIDAWIRT